MSTSTFPRVAAAASIIAAAAIVGCQGDRTSVTNPAGSPSYDFPLVKPASTLLPGGSVVVTKPATGSDSVRISLIGLEPLTSGVYQIWLASTQADATGDTAVTDLIKATGALTVVRADSTITEAGDLVIARDTSARRTASSFTEGGANITVSVKVTPASLGVDPLTRNLVLVTIESDDNATAPTTTGPRPFWRKFSKTTSSSGALNFGTFNPRPSLQYIYLVTGRGLGGIRDNVLIVDDSALRRPPVGYYYATFLVQRDAASKVTSTLSLGAQTAPLPRRDVSLRNADIQIVDEVVTERPPEILAAASRVRADTVTSLPKTHPFAAFANVWVTLEAKAGDETKPSPTIILNGAVPDKVRSTTP